MDEGNEATKDEMKKSVREEHTVDNDSNIAKSCETGGQEETVDKKQGLEKDCSFQDDDTKKLDTNPKSSNAEKACENTTDLTYAEKASDADAEVNVGRYGYFSHKLLCVNVNFSVLLTTRFVHLHKINRYKQV